MGYAIEPCASEELMGFLEGADLNSVSDQLISLPDGGKRITRIVIANASGTTATASGGFYTQANKAGNAVVNSNQVYSTLSATRTLRPSLNNDYIAGNDLYFSLSIAEGAASTCDIYVYGETLKNP